MFPMGLLAIGERAVIAESGGCFPAAEAWTGHGQGHGRRHGCRGCGLHGGGPRGAASRVEDLGIRAGKTVEMLNNEGGRSLLVKVDGTRVAFSRAIAMKIMVRRMEDEPCMP